MLSSEPSIVEISDTSTKSTPFNYVCSPGVADACCDHAYNRAGYDLALLETELKAEKLVDLTDVAVVGQIDGLVLGEAQILEHTEMTGSLDVQDVEVADVLSGHAGLAKSLVDAVIPVGHGYGIEQPLHLGRIHQAELAELGNVFRGYGLGDAADLGATGMDYGAVGHEVGTEKLILLIALLQNYCATAAAEVKHEGYTVIGEVDEIAVAVTACNEDCLAFRHLQ